jgi:SAM-dependent methyltransferase
MRCIVWIAMQKRPGPLSWLMKRLHGPVYASRLKELVRQITPHLRPGDRVLDVGCGFGALGRAIMDSPACPKGVEVFGLERVKRGGEAIPVEAYDGVTIPYADGSFDVVIVADVLHHEEDPHRLIGQCARVSRRLLVIKDHKVEGPLARQRISLLDWAANAPYGVPCLYRYNTPAEWAQWQQRHALTPQAETKSLRLYPFPYNLVFTGRLQYMGIFRVAGGEAKIAPAPTGDACPSSSGSERASSTSSGSAPSSTPATAG